MHTHTKDSSVIIPRSLPQRVTMQSRGLWVVAGAYENPDQWFLQPETKGVVGPDGEAWKLHDLVCHVGVHLWMRVQTYPGGPKVTVNGPIIEAIAMVQPEM